MDLTELLAAMDAPMRRQRLVDLVQQAISEVLRHPSADSVAVDRPFQDFGFDSVMAVELRGRLSEALGLRLPATLVYDQPNPEALAEHLVERVEDRMNDPLAPVHRELDAIEDFVESSPDTAAAQAALTRRLTDLFGHSATAAAAATEELPAHGTDPSLDHPDVDLGSASAEDIFGYIDGQLGRSSG
ncbi:hypothetical protein BL253_38115 [Pseudofrankia asymbiotica]|uniref:Carrier domain-containing protein n=1 Tax=Pseudofrankia asymbiotica TaxID=1834516 RepID=A0A1V2HYL1_9ACTN|nr:hypothetical protein BL253_38115 [Pseudofrankia asymbiotica]